MSLREIKGLNTSKDKIIFIRTDITLVAFFWWIFPLPHLFPFKIYIKKLGFITVRLAVISVLTALKED